MEWPTQYNLPPFFTLQPVLATREKQLKIWMDLVLKYIEVHNKSEIHVCDDMKSDLFCNASIKRSLSEDTVVLILDELCNIGYGIWKDDQKMIFELSSRTILDWAHMMYTWAHQNQIHTSICTVYEIKSGDIAMGEEFQNLETNILIAALRALEEQGKVTLIDGDTLLEIGVKFL